MCFDLIAHILHPLLMKFHCSLHLSRLMDCAYNRGIKEVLDLVSQMAQVVLCIHGHGYTKGVAFLQLVAAGCKLRVPPIRPAIIGFITVILIVIVNLAHMRVLVEKFSPIFSYIIIVFKV